MRRRRKSCRNRVALLAVCRMARLVWTVPLPPCPPASLPACLPYPLYLCIRTFVLPELPARVACQSCLSAIGITKSKVTHTQFPLFVLVIKLTIHHHTSSSSSGGIFTNFFVFFVSFLFEFLNLRLLFHL